MAGTLGSGTFGTGTFGGAGAAASTDMAASLVLAARIAERTVTTARASPRVRLTAST